MPGREALVAALRDDGVASPRVLAAIAAVPRERFVPRHLRARAWDDEALPIEGGQTISQPRVVARMCELLNVRQGDRVLDVGTGSGWHAAVLAQLGARVTGVERDAGLAAQARAALAPYGVEVLCADGSTGLPERGPWEAVNVAAATPLGAVERLASGLAPGGRLVAPVQREAGEEWQQLLLLTRHADGTSECSWEEHVRFVPLLGGDT